jgi:hypothetical protein
VRLERVVEHRLRPVLGLDDHVGRTEACVDVTALVPARVLVQRLAPHRLLRIEQRLKLLPLDVDQRQRLPGAAGIVRGNGRDWCAVEAQLALEHVAVVGTDRSEHAWRRECGREIELLDARASVGAAQHGRVQCSRQREIGGVHRLTARTLVPVDALRPTADDGTRALRPRLDGRVLVDDDPLLGVAAFDLFLGANQSCHVRTASSIRGYAPQRQRLPAIACRTRSGVGWGSASTSAAAETI